MTLCNTIAGDQTALRYSDTKDQNGFGASPSTNLKEMAAGQWYHRIIALPAEFNGKSVGKVIFACDHDGDGGDTVKAQIRHIYRLCFRPCYIPPDSTWTIGISVSQHRTVMLR